MTGGSLRSPPAKLPAPSRAPGHMRKRRCDTPSNFRNDVLSLAFQLDVPVQVIAPSLRGAPKTDGYVEHRGDPLRRTGTPDETHAGLFRREPPLLVIALEAARDDVLLGLTAPFDNGYHVIKCEVLGRA